MGELVSVVTSDHPACVCSRQGACITQCEVVHPIMCALEACAHLRAVLEPQHDLLARAEARLADVVRRGRVVTDGLVLQGKDPHIDLPQDVALTVNLLLLELLDLRLELLVFRGELRSRLVN